MYLLRSRALGLSLLAISLTSAATLMETSIGASSLELNPSDKSPQISQKRTTEPSAPSYNTNKANSSEPAMNTSKNNSRSSQQSRSSSLPRRHQAKKSTPAIQSAQANKHNSSSSRQQQQLSHSQPHSQSLSQSHNRQTPMSTNEVDDLAQAQLQARLMLAYNNTPPLFVTNTRDFFVDVARHTIGSKVTTMQAIDMEGDRLEYSLKSANLHDAASYFTIHPNSGELRLANKQLPFFPTEFASNKRDQPDSGPGADSTDEPVIFDGISSSTSAESSSAVPELYPENDDSGVQFFNRNLYFLNVAVSDGHYTSVVELQIHAINSSAISSGSPIQLTPEGGRKASEQMESLIRNKAHQFYENLQRTQAGSQSNPTNAAALVYPNFVNPSLIKPEQQLTVHNSLPESDGLQQVPDDQTIPSTLSPTKLETSSDRQQLVERHQPEIVGIGTTPNRFNGLPTRSDQSLEPPFHPQPMLVSLVLACSCLMIALVLLMFIVPLSVKRLRKRLKQVEHAHHEHLSQRTSHGSTICSSSTGSTVGDQTNHHLGSCMSQFTLGSSASCVTGGSVCRQSSLDSSIGVSSRPQLTNNGVPPSFVNALATPHLNRLNNGSIANPIYLDQQRQHIARGLVCEPSQLRHDLAPCFFQTSSQPMTAQLLTGFDDATEVNNIYHPLEDASLDDFYTTINPQQTQVVNQTSKTLFSTNQMVNTSTTGGYKMTECPPPSGVERMTRSPDGSESGSSTRSLARFLSLPARHSSQPKCDSQQSDSTGDDLFKTNSKKPEDKQVSHLDQLLMPTPKTIARATHVAREQQPNEHIWEVDRHKIKLIKIIGEGQFGLVWICKLRQMELGSEQIVAAKTMKASTTRDRRGREDLLAEIEIMKLVCQHPNVVKILHCCTKDTSSQHDLNSSSANNPILLIMEYLELGKLQTFLETSRLNHLYATNLYYQVQTDHEHPLTSRDLIKFIYHVAKGMEYISSHCIVHRDLASRNIMVSSKRICKIGDFGMARLMQSPEGIYERQTPNAKLPVRWMAPEVFMRNVFTTQSDVFSFGILMWEVVTLGSTPYSYLKTDQVMNEVARNGLRPERPDYCHPELYKIMSQCWSQGPEDRPTFSNLVNQLDALLLSANDYIELDQYPDHNYYNIPKTAAPNELL